MLLGPYVLVMDHVHGSAGRGPIIHQDLVPRGRIVVEAGAWLGAYSCILPGRNDVVIGRQSIVGAGAVVTESVPPNSVIVGAKGRVLSSER